LLKKLSLHAVRLNRAECEMLIQVCVVTECEKPILLNKYLYKVFVREKEKVSRDFIKVAHINSAVQNKNMYNIENF
jgi:hypothetical protein